MVRDHDRVGQGGVGVMAERAHELGAGNPFHESLEGMSAGKNDRSCGPESGYSDSDHAAAPEEKTRRVETGGRGNQAVGQRSERGTKRF
jgi:hypothetical protein